MTLIKMKWKEAKTVKTVKTMKTMKMKIYQVGKHQRDSNNCKDFLMDKTPMRKWRGNFPQQLGAGRHGGEPGC